MLETRALTLLLTSLELEVGVLEAAEDGPMSDVRRPTISRWHRLYLHLDLHVKGNVLALSHTKDSGHHDQEHSYSSMETLHKLAGVTETSNTTEQPPQPLPNAPPIPPDADHDNTDAHSLSHRASRVSLPLNRRASQKSFRSGRREQPLHGEADAPPVPTLPQGSRPGSAQGRSSHGSAGSGSEDEEYAWGPSHPCFPHPNPHCAPESEEARNTRVIRVRRDWLSAGDLYPQYANLYPEILDPHVSDEDFRFLISSINSRVKDAFDPYTTRAWVDAAMGVVTGYLWDDVGLTGAKRGVKGLEAFVERWNAEKRAKGKGVVLVQPRRTGFMTLDFVIADPGIDGVGGEAEGGIGPAE